MNKTGWPVADVRAFKLIIWITATCCVWAVVNWAAGVRHGPWMAGDFMLAGLITAAARQLRRFL